MATLTSFNISPDLIVWFREYLFGSRQRLRIQNSHSDWSPVVAEVPQDGVLSPLLFSVFINTSSGTISSLYHLYADM